MTTRKTYWFQLQDYHLFELSFPGYSFINIFFNSPHINTTLSPYYPHLAPLPLMNNFLNVRKSGARWVWAVSVSLATTREIQFVSFPPGTEMFYFPGCAPYISCMASSDKKIGFPIRTSSDRRLLGTSPKHFAAMLRPSSPYWTKASTIRSYKFPLGNL